MGLLKAAFDAIGGTFADQWKDFYTIPEGLAPTAALFPAVPRGTNLGRGSDTQHSEYVISNGSKIVVPEGYGLILVEDGKITGFATEAGGYEWNSDAQDSQSIFAGNGLLSPLIRTSWERFKFGGRPKAQQQAFFVSLKELPNNRFATASEIYWDDAYLRAQVGATARGSYTLRIADPILFVANWVPATYLQGGYVFDFTDLSNDAGTQLFNEVIGSLAPAFAQYANDSDKAQRMSRIQQDSLGFAEALADAVEQGYHWRTQRGLEIVATAIVSMEYDEMSRELLRTAQRADALMGARGNSNLQASVAAGVQAAGEEGGAGLLGFGVGVGSLGIGGLLQPDGAAATPGATVPAPGPAAAEDPVAQLTKFKELLDAGLITQDDYDAAKAKVLGL